MKVQSYSDGKSVKNLLQEIKKESSFSTLKKEQTDIFLNKQISKISKTGEILKSLE